MAMKKTGLGKGLEALFQENQLTKEEEKKLKNGEEIVQNIKVIEIEPNKNQPRRTFPQESIEELAKSIEKYGIIQPIIVTKRDGYYEIIAGERRWRAAKKAGLKEMPCIVRESDERKNKEIALIENIQREDLNPFEKALGIRHLMEKYGLTQEQVSKKLGKSRSSISNTVRILYLAPDVLELVKQGKLTEGHCKALAGIEDADRQYAAALRMIDRGESVRQAESKNRITKNEKKIDPKYKYLYEDIEDRFQGFFGTKVKLDQGKRKGRIIIEYHNNEDLERMLNLIKEN